MQSPAFESLLVAAQDGADWAWERLYHEYAGRLLRYLRSRSAADPENLLGDVFLQVARNVGGFSGDEPAFRAWLFTIAHRRLLDERRSQRRRPAEPRAELPEPDPGAADVTADEAVTSLGTARVRALIGRLAPAQQDVLLLRIVGGLTVTEVAAATGRSEGAVKALQRRGLAALRRMLEHEAVPL